MPSESRHRPATIPSRHPSVDRDGLAEEHVRPLCFAWSAWMMDAARSNRYRRERPAPSFGRRHKDDGPLNSAASRYRITDKRCGQSPTQRQEREFDLDLSADSGPGKIVPVRCGLVPLPAKRSTSRNPARKSRLALPGNSMSRGICRSANRVCPSTNPHPNMTAKPALGRRSMAAPFDLQGVLNAAERRSLNFRTRFDNSVPGRGHRRHKRTVCCWLLFNRNPHRQ